MGVRLSEKHGLNPSLACCFACGKEYGVALLGRLKGDEEAPRYVLTEELCDDCKKAIEDGYVLCIGYSEVKNGGPIRTGECLKLKEKAFKKVFDAPVPEHKICYMQKEVIEHLLKAAKQNEDGGHNNTGEQEG